MRRKILIYILLLILFIFAIFVGGKFPYLLLFLVMIILIYSNFSIYKNKKNLEGVFWTNKDKFIRGETIEIEYKIYNGGLFPIPYVQLDQNLHKNLIEQKDNTRVYFIKSFDYIKFKKKFKANHRGVYDLGSLNITLEDVFEISKANITIKDPLKITVFPKIYNIKDINLLGKEFFGSDKTNEKHNEDYSNIKNLREYNSGDSIKRIHWKTSARKGEFFVKNYNTSSNLNIKLFLDFQIDKFSHDDKFLEERLVELTSSIIYFTLTKGIETEFITYSNEKINLKLNNVSLFNHYLNSIISIFPKNNRRISNIISEEINTTSIGTTVIIVTVDIDENMIETIFNIRKKGINITVFIIKDIYSKIDEEKISNLRTLKVVVYKLFNGENIEKILGE
ncbi:DUF58 domain-containing protein [Senegalia massiliensis]|uniref:DUF58 domain-containing protein n=1 Tax=Senegalia massiliensis TaxID=1720316 RepID=UPI001031188C|nr:DUF58 domain-containing protein [Senegalia massiliensis]